MARDFMPILRHPEFRLPWSLIEPHAEQAMRNHGQTLERLAERGGLGFCEAAAIICDLPWSHIHLDEQFFETWLRERIAEWLVSLPREVPSGLASVNERQGFAFRKHLSNECIGTISATDAGLSRALSAWLVEMQGNAGVQNTRGGEQMSGHGNQDSDYFNNRPAPMLDANGWCYVHNGRPGAVGEACICGRFASNAHAALQEPHPLDALLPEICQLLDTARDDFKQRGLWTEWDQSVRDRVTAYNLSRRTSSTVPHGVIETSAEAQQAGNGDKA